VTTELLNREQAAEYIGVSYGTLANWDSTKRFKIPRYKIGRLIRYKKEDLDNWLEQQKVDSIVEG
jgi:excisionase family DNA binding protein